MKAFVLSGCVTALLCACAEKDQTQIKVPWPPGVAYVPVCKPMVKYQGTSFEIQGVKVPVPALGGGVEVGGVKVDPKILNQAYQTTQTLDFYFRSTCPLLASYTTDKAKFEQAVEDMRAAQVKLTQLALSLQTAQPAATPAPLTASAPAKEGSKTPAQPAASPVGKAAAKTAVQPVASAAAEAQPPAKNSAVKRKLARWVQAYAKTSKTKVVRTAPKPNTALDLPSTAPTPVPLPK